MADVTGPISTLPGAVRNIPEGTMCDEHQDRPAVKRVQGETDSFGSEQHDMCQECYDKHRAYRNALGGAEFVGYCESCKAPDERPLFAWRDYDEGMAGPIYHQCAACRSERHKQEAEEYALRDDDDFEDYDDYRDSGDDSPDDKAFYAEQDRLANQILGSGVPSIYSAAIKADDIESGRMSVFSGEGFVIASVPVENNN